MLAAIHWETLKTFGNPRTFAIQYKPEDNGTVDANSKLAYCHFIIGNTFLGHTDEICYLSTWVFYLTDVRNSIEQSQEQLFPKEFFNLSDREIYETCLRSVQSEEEYHPDFLYLPRLGMFVSRQHQFTMDETLDGYEIFYYVKANKLTFLIEDCLGMGYETRRSFKFVFSTVALNDFLETVNEAIVFLTKTYPYLTDHISKRTFNSR